MKQDIKYVRSKHKLQQSKTLSHENYAITYYNNYTWSSFPSFQFLVLNCTIHYQKTPKVEWTLGIKIFLFLPKNTVTSITNKSIYPSYVNILHNSLKYGLWKLPFNVMMKWMCSGLLSVGIKLIFSMDHWIQSLI